MSLCCHIGTCAKNTMHALTVNPHLARACCGLQALQETFLIFRLAVLLYSYLGLGTRWTGKLIRLILYSMLLLPGFIQVRNAFGPSYLKQTVCCPDRSPA